MLAKFANRHTKRNKALVIVELLEVMVSTVSVVGRVFARQI